MTIDPPGSWRRSLSPVTSSLPSGSQSMEYPWRLGAANHSGHDYGDDDLDHG
jgi:hypothetical protein